MTRLYPQLLSQIIQIKGMVLIICENNVIDAFETNKCSHY